jgi:transcriptional regulator with XRE-family HTH domain
MLSHTHRPQSTQAHLLRVQRELAMGKRTDPYDVEVGRRIRARRMARQMSQMDLAGHLGLTFQQVQKYEKGTNRVAAGRLKRIARILDVPILYFFDDTDEVGNNGAAPDGLPDNSRALRLMRAYSRIDNSSLQQSILDLTEKIATERRSASNLKITP